MATNTKNADESYGRSTLQDKQDLQEAGESRGSPRFSGQIRVMQRPELVMTRRPAAATAAELEQHGVVRGRRRQRKESEKGSSGRPIYKANS